MKPDQTGLIKFSPKTHGKGQDVYIPGAGKMGMILFLASLSMLFAASMTGYLVIRFRQESWPPPDAPGLPWGLWISTLVILLSSFTIQKALSHIRKNDTSGLKTWLVITTLLGGLFLVLQSINWYGLVRLHLTMTVNLYAFTFFMLTGLHAAHVMGGLVLLGFVIRKAYQNSYDSGYHPGVLYSAMYWHFLDAVWVIMFAVLMISQ